MVINAISVVGPPLEEVPHQELVGHVRAIGTIHATVPAEDGVIENQFGRRGHAVLTDPSEQELDHAFGIEQIEC